MLFKCSRNTEVITITKSPCDIGTTIRIAITSEIMDFLLKNPKKWDWYSSSELKVIRRIITSPTDFRELPQNYKLPHSNSDLDSDYFRTFHDDFDDLIWTYIDIDSYNYYYRRMLFCNGVYVCNDLYIDDINISDELNLIRCNTPSLIVYDQDGRLPLNLERTGLNTRTISFANELKLDISKYFTDEFIKIFHDNECWLNSNCISNLISPKFKGFGNNEGKTSKFLLSTNKAIPMDMSLIHNSKVKQIILDAPQKLNDGVWNKKELFESDTFFLPSTLNHNSKSASSEWVRYFFEFRRDYYGGMFGIGTLPISSRRILISKNEVLRLVSPSYIPKTFWKILNKEWENDDWIMYTLGSIEPINFDVDKVCDYLKQNNQFVLIQYFLDWTDLDEIEQKSAFSIAWMDKLKKPYIEK